jgi:hypothetical protein
MLIPSEDLLNLKVAPLVTVIELALGKTPAVPTSNVPASTRVVPV